MAPDASNGFSSFGGQTSVPLTPQHAPLRGVGLTPRVLEEVLRRSDATFDALPATYIRTIDRHAESVAPNKQVMADNFVPVLLETEGGSRRVVHVDPLVLRRFRRKLAEELRGTRTKRRKLLARMRALRRALPRPRDQDVAEALECEVQAAEARVGERLLQPLPSGTKALHVLMDAGSHMLQLRAVARQLATELPAILEAAGCERLSLRALGARPRVPPLEGVGAEEAVQWLEQLAEAEREGESGWRLAPALKRVEGGETVLLLACSSPTDLEASLAAVSAGLVVQAVGIFGTSPEDPEPTLQQLADSAGRGSSLHLFFGAEYWTKFAALRRKQLEAARQRITEERRVLGAEVPGEDGDVTSPKVLEVRLIERVMRECYEEERLCEEELTCASRVLDRTLVDREEVVAAIRLQGQQRQELAC